MVDGKVHMLIIDSVTEQNNCDTDTQDFRFKMENYQNNSPLDDTVTFNRYKMHYQRLFEDERPNHNQSEFISSTSWTIGDTKWYKSQVNNTGNGEEQVQVSDISSSDDKTRVINYF